jgi:hypothetical protein
MCVQGDQKIQLTKETIKTKKRTKLKGEASQWQARAGARASGKIFWYF